MSRAVWEHWQSDWEELETIPEEYLDAGDRVVVAVYFSGRGRATTRCRRSGVP